MVALYLWREANDLGFDGEAICPSSTLTSDWVVIGWLGCGGGFGFGFIGKGLNSTH